MIGFVSPTELAGALQRGEVAIDVRSPEEFAHGHAPGTIFMPLFSVPLRLSELSRHAPVYVVCESGARAMQASQYLDERGYDVLNLQGGMAAWRAAGLPVATGAATHAGV